MLPDLFDLRAWHEGTMLSSFGMELCVTAGRASLRLEHVAPEGWTEVLCTRDQLTPGSAFTPPLFMKDLDGMLRPAVSASEDAVYDLYFGTNDRPETPVPRLALIVDAGDDRDRAEAVMAACTCWRAEFEPHESLEILLCLGTRVAEGLVPVYGVTPLIYDAPPGTSRVGRAVYEVVYGRLGALPLTHVGLCPAPCAAEPEAFVRLLGLAGFLRPGVQLACAPAGGEGLQAESWGWHLFDIRDIQNHGLPHLMRPDDDGTEFVARLAGGGVRVISAASLGAPWRKQAPDPAPLPWAEVPAPSRLQRLFGRVGQEAAPAGSVNPQALLTSFPAWEALTADVPPAALPRPESAAAAEMLRRHREVTGLRLTISTQGRAALRDLAAMNAPLIARLRAADLLETDRIRADLDRANRVALSLLRGRHRGERVYIIGNGPSLLVADLDRLTGATTFASNKIYLAYEQTAWRPSYYSVEDHLVLRNNMEQIAALDGSLKIFPANMRDFGYHGADTVFMPFLPPASFETPLSDPDFPGFSRDLSHGVFWGSTITYTQIQMALYMGAAEIILLGIDHSYALPDTRIGNAYVHAGERNHFHPDYREEGEIWHQPNLDVLEVSYGKARDVCAAAGVRIVNASRRTALGVFDRADLDALLAEAGR